MDLSTLLGISLASAALLASVVLSGGNFQSFWDAPSILIVVGGSLGALLVCFPLKTIRRLPQVVMKGMSGKLTNPRDVIEQIVSLAVTARRDGLLALEPRLDEIEDPFIRLGVQMAIDGTRPDLLEEVLHTEMETMQLRHREGKGTIDQLGRYAPAFGMIGTLVGLITMLSNMSDPATLGSGMSVALVTTLYGAILANGSLLPMSEKLNYLSRQETLLREMIVRGIISLQAGENPRLIEQRLLTYLPPEDRNTRVTSRAA